ncbi:MAG TPA: hypothetical protein VF618_04885 [Thermoanaerobaculia bacterium]
MKRLMLVLFLFGCQQQEAPPAVETAATQPAPPPVTQTAPPLPVVQGPKLLPVDQSAQDAAFAAYRAKLLDAVARKDAAALLTLVDPKIRTSFGDGGGTNDLRKMWKLDEGAASPLWNELHTILTMGGTFRNLGNTKQFCAPYVYSAWPEEHDAFMSFAVIAENVPLVDAAGKPIATLSHDIVAYVPDAAQSAEEFERAERRRVKTADGREGFVATANLRSPIGWRACFAPKGNDWKMDLLVRGD